MVDTNTTTLNVAIDRLQDALSEARLMPEWGLAIIVVISLLCVIIIIHVLALMLFAPCLYGLWRRRVNQQQSNRVSDDEVLEPPEEAEEKL